MNVKHIWVVEDIDIKFNGYKYLVRFIPSFSVVTQIHKTKKDGLEYIKKFNRNGKKKILSKYIKEIK